MANARFLVSSPIGAGRGAEVCQQFGHLAVTWAVLPLLDGQRALQQAALLGGVIEGTLRIAEVPHQCDGRAVAGAALASVHDQRALQHVARFRCVADSEVRGAKHHHR